MLFSVLGMEHAVRVNEKFKTTTGFTAGSAGTRRRSHLEFRDLGSERLPDGVSLNGCVSAVSASSAVKRSF
jgi:hypothetical protein